ACAETLSACAELGFQPVDGDGDFRKLQAAIRDHQANPKGEAFARITFRDDLIGPVPFAESSPVDRLEQIRAAAIPARVPASWLDGLTAASALQRFTSANGVPMEVVIGATTHPGGVDADPFSSEPFGPARPRAVEQFKGDVAFVERVLA